MSDFERREIARKLLGHMKGADDNFVEWIFDLALDVMEVPEDNSVEACEQAWNTKEWPEWGYCRDWTLGAWIECDEDINKFISWVSNYMRQS